MEVNGIIQPKPITPSLKRVPTSMTVIGCIPQAIQKDGRTLEQILKDIEHEKQLEVEVMELHKSGLTDGIIARRLKIKESKVSHIIQFDELGLSYRKVGKPKN